MSKPVTDDSFANEVLQAPGPVLVDFWAEWCGPCKQIAPALEEISEELGEKLTIAKVDVDSGDVEWVAGAVEVDEDGMASGNPGYSGDEGPLFAVVLNTPYSVIFDSGKMLIADSGNAAIRAQLSDGTVDTIVGRGPMGYSGDGEEAENASLQFPQDIELGVDGDLLIADTNNGVIRWVAKPTW